MLGGARVTYRVSSSVCVRVCMCMCAFANFQLELNSNLVRPTQPRPLGNKLCVFSPSLSLWFIFFFFIVTELSAQFSQKFRERERESAGYQTGGCGGFVASQLYLMQIYVN